MQRQYADGDAEANPPRAARYGRQKSWRMGNRATVVTEMMLGNPNVLESKLSNSSICSNIRR